MTRISIGIATLLAAVLQGVAQAQDWYPSKYGADDTLGAINNMSPALVVEAARLVTKGKTYALGVETGPDSPAYGPRTYSMTVLQLDDGTGTPLGSNKATGNDDLMTLWMGIGSQIDGLGHMGINHVYYNGNRAQDFVTPSGLTRLSIDRLPPIVSRVFCSIWPPILANQFLCKVPCSTERRSRQQQKLRV